ncbi:protein-arginine deiminase domain-containing protein [Aspergillus puulaauensis]|uniref:Protein-arginine deiminase C-terminal domain-containing protein n=1 Tax=Aspergillus puulaauensis TaxID=1220207 RepID=A0A7R8AM13_9EURO|nr:uncharacterized protein APUU_40933S [Aspergillus puulaauensis]BCS24489.1 hypothetical protein APUU_40933S [Aspergillus puulaauensis]
MRLTPSNLGLVALATLPSALAALHPDIRADTNRDGGVDISGNSDVSNKAVWSASSGAIFLPNIGDTTGRCPKTDLNGGKLSNDELAYCNDASGDVLLSPKYVAPLRTVPMKDLSSDAYGYVYATPDAAYQRVRLFLKGNGDSGDSTAWTLLDERFRLNATQLQEGLVLGLDSRELVKDSDIWDGNVVVKLDVFSGKDSGSDAVALKLAPVLTHHHLQKVDTLISVAGESDAQRRFLSDLNDGRREAGIQTPTLLLNGTENEDIWAQDFLEPAYASMPGPDGPISIRIVLRSAQSTRVAGRQVFHSLRGEGIGGFQPGPGFGHEEINSFGNVETTPPYTSKSGVVYKSGRIITGKHFNQLPADSMLTFLNSQKVQEPLILETGWLLVGHVDEFVQFLPFDNERGWTIGIADTIAAMKLLQDASKSGHGDVHAISFNRTSDAVDEGLADPEDLELTIDDLLANKTFQQVNKYAQRHIDANLGILLSEVDLPLEQVIRVPTLFKTSNFNFPPNHLPPHTGPVLAGEFQLVSFLPATVNGVVLGKHYVSPKPWGPVVEGDDIMAKASRQAYARANMSISFVDDYLSHHVVGGEVHCGSNTLREADVTWWS